MTLLTGDPAQELAAVLDPASPGPALIFKHSPDCWTSVFAGHEIARFEAFRPDVPLLAVNVVADRPLARALADRLGVRHQSPQVILVSGGRVRWSASHDDISQDRIEREVARVG